MYSAIALIFVLIVAAGAVYRFGRNSKTVEVQAADIKEGEKINEILEKQRDNRINNINDADSFWLSRKPKKD